MSGDFRAVRLVVVPVGRGTRADPKTRLEEEDPAAFALRLVAAIEARRASDATGLFEGLDVACHAEAAPGVVGDGARAEAARGQIVLELVAAPRARGGSEKEGAKEGATNDAPSANRLRRALVVLAADALKGHLSGPVETETSPLPPLETQAADASDPETVRALCRATCWPALLGDACDAEADVREGTSRVAELVASAPRGLGALFSATELRRVLRAARAGEINAVEAGARGAT